MMDLNAADHQISKYPNKMLSSANPPFFAVSQLVAKSPLLKSVRKKLNLEANGEIISYLEKNKQKRASEQPTKNLMMIQLENLENRKLERSEEGTIQEGSDRKKKLLEEIEQIRTNMSYLKYQPKLFVIQLQVAEQPSFQKLMLQKNKALAWINKCKQNQAVILEKEISQKVLAQKGLPQKDLPFKKLPQLNLPQEQSLSKDLPQKRLPQQDLLQKGIVKKKVQQKLTVKEKATIDRDKAKQANFEEFFKRRIETQNQKVDLGVYSLAQLLEKANAHQVISYQLYCQFVRTHKDEKLKEFIKLMGNNQLRTWDSKKFKFTIADHRRLAQLLVKLYPQKYVLASPQSLIREVNSFLQQMYSLSKNNYAQVMREVDKQLNLSWWRNLQIKYSLNPIIPDLRKIDKNTESLSKIDLQDVKKKVLKSLNKAKKPAIPITIQAQPKNESSNMPNKRIEKLEFKPEPFFLKSAPIPIKTDYNQLMTQMRIPTQTYNVQTKLRDFQRSGKVMRFGQ